MEILGPMQETVAAILAWIIFQHKNLKNILLQNKSGMIKKTTNWNFVQYIMLHDPFQVRDNLDNNRSLILIGKFFPGMTESPADPGLIFLVCLFFLFQAASAWPFVPRMDLACSGVGCLPNT